MSQLLLRRQRLTLLRQKQRLLSEEVTVVVTFQEEVEVTEVCPTREERYASLQHEEVIVTLVTLSIDHIVPRHTLELSVLEDQLLKPDVQVLEASELVHKAFDQGEVPLKLIRFDKLLLQCLHLGAENFTDDYLLLFNLFLFHLILYLFDLLFDLVVLFPRSFLICGFVVIEEVVKGQIELLVEAHDLGQELIEGFLVRLPQVGLADVQAVSKLEKVLQEVILFLCIRVLRLMIALLRESHLAVLLLWLLIIIIVIELYRFPFLFLLLLFFSQSGTFDLEAVRQAE